MSFPSLLGLEPTSGLQFGNLQTRIPDLTPLLNQMKTAPSSPTTGSDGGTADEEIPEFDEFRTGFANQLQGMYRKNLLARQNLENLYGVEQAQKLPEYKRLEQEVERDILSNDNMIAGVRERKAKDGYAQVVQQNNGGNLFNLDQWMRGSELKRNDDWLAHQEASYTDELQPGSSFNQYHRNFAFNPTFATMEDARKEVDALMSPAMEKMNESEWSKVLGDYAVGSTLGIMTEHGRRGNNHEQMQEAYAQSMNRLGLTGAPDISDKIVAGYMQGFMQRTQQREDGRYYNKPMRDDNGDVVGYTQVKVIDKDDAPTTEFQDAYADFVTADITDHYQKRLKGYSGKKKNYSQYNEAGYSRGQINDELVAASTATTSVTYDTAKNVNTGAFTKDQLKSIAIQSGFVSSDISDEDFKEKFDLFTGENGILQINTLSNGEVVYLVKGTERNADGTYVDGKSPGQILASYGAAVFSNPDIPLNEQTTMWDIAQKVAGLANDVNPYSFRSNENALAQSIDYTALATTLADFHKQIEGTRIELWGENTVGQVGNSYIEMNRMPGTVIDAKGDMRYQEAPYMTNWDVVRATPNNLSLYQQAGIQVTEKDGMLFDANGNVIRDAVDAYGNITTPSFQGASDGGLLPIMTPDQYQARQARSDHAINNGNLQGVLYAGNHVFQRMTVGVSANEVDKLKSAKMHVPATFNVAEEVAKKYNSNANQTMDAVIDDLFSVGHNYQVEASVGMNKENVKMRYKNETATVYSETIEEDLKRSLGSQGINKNDAQVMIDKAKIDNGVIELSALNTQLSAYHAARSGKANASGEPVMWEVPIMDSKGNVNSHFESTNLWREATPQEKEQGYEFVYTILTDVTPNTAASIQKGGKQAVQNGINMFSTWENNQRMTEQGGNMNRSALGTDNETRAGEARLNELGITPTTTY